jgi:hypothetical protein
VVGGGDDMIEERKVWRVVRCSEWSWRCVHLLGIITVNLNSINGWLWNHSRAEQL